MRGLNSIIILKSYLATLLSMYFAKFWHNCFGEQQNEGHVPNNSAIPLLGCVLEKLLNLCQDVNDVHSGLLGT